METCVWALALTRGSFWCMGPGPDQCKFHADILNRKQTGHSNKCGGTEEFRKKHDIWKKNRTFVFSKKKIQTFERFGDIFGIIGAHSPRKSDHIARGNRNTSPETIGPRFPRKSGYISRCTRNTFPEEIGPHFLRKSNHISQEIGPHT